LLLEHVLGIDTVSLYINSRNILTNEDLSALENLIGRRLAGEPSAYITGHKEFYGIDLNVTPRVLIPRPETELLVEKAIELVENVLPRDCLIADIGTGCGAIAIALAVNLPQAKMYATDISDIALETAADNCLRQGVSDRVTLLQGNLSEPLPEPVHLIVANLPYIREADITELAPEIAKYEPCVALNGGISGLEVLEKLIAQSSARLLKSGAILLEIGYDQGRAVLELGKKYYPQADCSVDVDLSGTDRLATILLGR